MFISKVNFNQYQAKNNNYQQKGYLSFKGLGGNVLKNVVTSGPVTEQGANIAKKVLLSLTAFASLQGIASYKVKEAVKNGELDMEGKKVNAEGEKTKDYLQKLELYKEILVTKTDFSKEHKIKPEELEQAIANGELDVVDKKINPEDEKTKEYLQKLQLQKQLYAQTHMPREAFGRLIGISGKSIEWHIAKGNVEENEDGTIDSTLGKNKYFLENFKKGATKQVYKYDLENYDKLQKKLGPIKIEYCLERGYLVAEEDGSINMDNPINVEFIEKVKNKEIQIYDFYMSQKDFARMVRQSDITLRKAINAGEVIVDGRKGIDVSIPQNKAYVEKALANQVGRGKKFMARPEGYISRQQLADELGVSNASLAYHIGKGHVISDKNGIDLNNPVNQYFISNFQKGVVKDMPEGFEAVEVRGNGNRITKPNHVSKQKFAERLGMSTATLEYHILSGHVVYTGDGIDLSHPQNVHFMNNYKRGEVYIMPGEKKAVKPVNEEVVTEKNKSTKTNYNQLLMGELSKMLRICVSCLGFHFDRGRLEKTEDRKIDLSNSLNKEFIEKYKDNVIEAYAKMSDEELEESVKGLKLLLKNRMGENIYMVSAGMLDDLDALDGYMKYSLSKIVDVSNLTKEQDELLVSIMEDIVLEELANNQSLRPKFLESDEKLDIALYRYLLDEIIMRNNGQVTVEDIDAEVNFINENRVTQKLEKMLEDTVQEYEREVRLYKRILSKDIETLADVYTQHKFLSVATNYHKLINFNNEVMKKGLLEETDNKQIKIIVEKVLSQVVNGSFVLNDTYKNWKKGHNVKNAKQVVSNVIDEYGKSLIAKICTEEALKELQKANPTKEITMQDLEDVVIEKFDL